jgi:signal transduction histidine kinase
MARTIHVVDEELQREQQRLRQALAGGRMCALDYHVADDRVECVCDSDSVLGALNGRLSEVLGRIHPEDRARVERDVREVLDGGEQVEVDARMTGPTDGITWLLINAVVERDADGRAVRLVGVVRDNTARKEGQAVRHMQAQGERLRALGQMASGIAHDLNQSLALITGYSDMARQELSLEPPDLQRVREMVDITAQAALEGGHALRGLLSFVRSQKLIAEEERINVVELLHQVARLTGPRWRDASQLEGRPIELSVVAEAGLTVSGSTAALRDAITNLIFNAVDALQHGGSIVLRAWGQDEQVLIEVRDTGTGIPDDVLPRIFDPFFTTKGERGTGLGLPQVRRIVERHGGTVDVESAPWRGTTFRLSLPLSKDATEQGEVRAVERATPPPRRAIRILVVEDEQQLARMASVVLNQRGHHAVVATSGEQAITLLETEQPFELVISDLGLGPGPNGWELADAVRRRWPQTCFVLVTGWGAAIDPGQARERGVDRVLAKPYRIAELRQVADDGAASLANE